MHKLDLKFEIKAMGFSFFIPIIIIILSILHLFYQMKVLGVETIGAIIPKLEFLVVPAISIWIMYLFYEYYENKSLEVLLSYPIKGKEHVFFKVITFIFIYILFIIPVFILTFMMEDISSMILLSAQIIPQIIFLSGLLTVIITLTKNIGVGLSVIVGYTSIEFLTEGKLVSWYHLFYFNSNILNSEELFMRGIINVILGLSLLLASSKIIREI